MLTFLAHWDGKALVPDEPVDLPAGTKYRVTVRPYIEEEEKPTEAHSLRRPSPNAACAAEDEYPA